jgi:uncharacterized protein
MTNRLINELSPYLLQHAHNPVDWYPWGEEAFARARSDDKPVLLSIGYSACHWCHVMERESFEDDATAALMNELFVSIKVDREERPDLDGIYMTAVQGLTGRGGWPMTVFLTPDRKAFYGGTYFPPEDRGGSPSFKKVLLAISDAYKNRREEVLGQAETLVTFIQNQSSMAAPLDGLDSTLLDGAARAMVNAFDTAHGGFGGAPKFPPAMALDYLLRYHHRTGNEEALAVTEYTLRRMVSGGMYDQIGGGFHRYSVDERWLVPHFEKMLYDNALLARTYLHAYQATGFPAYRQITEETLGYVLREMRNPSGGFYSAQDADSAGSEGEYYLWSPEEVREAVGPENADLVCQYFGVRSPGGVEGKSVLTWPADPTPLAAQAGLSLDELKERIQPAAAALLATRKRRVAPDTDDKIVSAWNGMMLRTLAEAGFALENDYYLTAATTNAEFLLREMWRGGRLGRAYRGRPSDIAGYLEDYAAVADGLLALYGATFDEQWFVAAVEIADAMLSLFVEGEDGTLRDTASDAEQLVIRPKDRWDNATPSGTSLACSLLLRLWSYTGDGHYEQIARKEMVEVAGLVTDHALGFGYLLSSLDYYLGPVEEIAIVGEPDHPGMLALTSALRPHFLPNSVVARGNGAESGPIPLLADRGLIDGQPAAYVCHGFVCNLPVTTPDDLIRQLPVRKRRE